MPSPILARADALIQRRRGSHQKPDDIPLLTDRVETDEDFPVLCDLAPTIAATAQVLEIPDQTAPKIDLAQTSNDTLAFELARKIELRLLAELPRLIEATVKDYLAEQEMIAAQQNED
ncbi:MAG: hypothetical protein PHV02_10270 [Rhodocyclaceae bacterium]|nr:hypothetical protein [Rhodocyclaceae bacterium]